MLGRVNSSYLPGRPARPWQDLSDDDLYIIGAVCLSQKSLFPYSKYFAVSPVYSFIPYSKELVVSMFLRHFLSQKIWSFPCFLTLLYVCYEIAYFPYSKDLVVSHVYRHIPYSKELVVSMFLDTFVFKEFGLFSCLLKQ